MTCPICSRDSSKKYRPFCSRRCADVDLGNWLNGSYALPAEEPEDLEEAAEEMAREASKPN
ncbi:MAG: DNA gyrase inhibitor YacG [Paracoccaceae bacterium]